MNIVKILKQLKLVDILLIALVLFMLLLAGLKLSNKNLSELSDYKGENVKLRVKFYTIQRNEFLDVIKKGDKLSSNKDELDIKVTDVRKEPLQVVNLNKKGEVVKSSSKLKSIAYVTVEGMFLKKNLYYMFGSDEARVGSEVSLESQKYSFDATILNVEVLN